jgi:hypothetical protein
MNAIRLAAGVRAGAVSLTLLTTLACASHPHSNGGNRYESPASLLIELVERNPWINDTRYLVTVEPAAQFGLLQILGKSHASRRLNRSEVKQLIALAEHRLLQLAPTARECDDCTEFFLTVRFNDRAHFAVLTQLGGQEPAELGELFAIFGR